jgi:predicted dehydrogenase
MDHGVYQLDLAEWLCDTRFSSFLTHQFSNLKYTNIEMEDYGLAVARFNSGLTAVVEESWIGCAFTTGFELCGTRGEISADTASSPMLWVLSDRGTVSSLPQSRRDGPGAERDGSVPGLSECTDGRKTVHR